MKYFGFGSLLLVLVVVIFLGMFGKELFIASPIFGTLVHQDGSGAANIKITRSVHWIWNDKIYISSATTDSAGNFSLPAITDQSILATILPHQTTIDITLVIDYLNQQKTILALNKSNYIENGELSDWKKIEEKYQLVSTPLNISCNIDAEPSDEDNFFWGTCRLK